MDRFETPSELQAAFDTLLAARPIVFRVYDHDLGMLDIEATDRLAALRAHCVAGGGRRVEILLDDISRVARDHPKLMQLVRDFGHVLEIRQSDPAAPLPDQAFALADRHGVMLRADKLAWPGSLHPDDPARATPLVQSFDGMWQRSPASVSATTLGL